MLLFANYKTYSVAVDKDGKKHKAQGGKRVMYTSHHPCWDAKNRYDLPEICDFDYQVIKGILEDGSRKEEKKAPEPKDPKQKAPLRQPEKPAQKAEESFMNIPPEADEEIPFETENKKDPPKEKKPEADPSSSDTFRLPDHIPKKLQDLMYPNLASEEEVMEAVYQRGYFPRGTPFQNLPKDFVDGVLIGAWPQVMNVIREMRSKYDIPFND